MNKKAFLGFLLILTIIMGGQIFASGGQNTGGGIKEATTHKMYPSTNIPTGGTAPNVYREKLNYFSANFIKWYTDRGEGSKIYGYETPVPVRTIMHYSSLFQDAVSNFNKLYGEAFEKSRWTDAFKQAYNLDVTYKWIVPSADYNQQLRLDMAANDLPDIFSVQSQYDLKQMAEAGVIQELGSLKDKYTSNRDKEVWQSDNGTLLNMATFNGQLYGLPASVSHTDFFSYLWIRKDWLDALHLQFPKTLDELATVMEAFNSELRRKGINDPVGIALDRGLYYATRGISNGFKAYPEVWEVVNGAVQWGGIGENNKKALIYLNNLYKKGLIDREWISFSGTDQLRAVINGRCGIVYGGHWLVQSLRQMPSLDPKVEWVCPPLPTADGKPVNNPITPNFRGWVAVNSNFRNPEVAYKMLSLFSYVFSDKDCDWWVYEGGTQSINYALGFTNISAMDNYLTYLNLMDAYKANNPGLLKAKGIPYWANLHSDLQWEWDNMFGPLPNAAMTVLDEAFKRNGLFYNAFVGVPSTYMQERWQSILDEQLITYTKIITGDLEVNAGFDAWVRSFNSMGGDRITQEVNNWYKQTVK